MPTPNRIIIDVTSDPKGIKETVAGLHEIGAVSDENAKKFKENHEKAKAQIENHIDWNTKLSRSIRDVGEGIVAAFAVERMVEFGKESIKLFADMEEGIRKLSFAVTKINGEPVKSFEKLNEQAEKLSNSLNTLFTPTQIRNLQTQFVQFGLTAQQVEKITPRVLDLAKATGKTLPEAAEKMILAINGQTKGLRDIGVAFKDTGSKTQNLNLLLQQTAKFDGAAAASLKSTTSVLQEYANKWEETKVAVGGFLVESGTDILEVFDNLSHAFDKDADSEEKWNKQLKLTKEQLEALHSISLKIVEDRLSLARQSGVSDDIILKQSNEYKIQLAKRYSKDVEDLDNKKLESELANLKRSEEEAQKHKSVQGKIMTQADFDRVAELQKTNGIAVKIELDRTKKIEILEEELARRQSKIQEDLTLKGEAELAAAIERQKKLWEKYAVDLEKIQKEIFDIESGAKIDLMENEQAKKLKQEDKAYQDKIFKVTEQQKQLADIALKGSKEESEKALIQLEETHKELELLQKGHVSNIEKINKDADAKEAEEEKKKADALLTLKKEEVQTESRALQLAIEERLIKRKITQQEYDLEMDKIKLGELEKQYQLEQDAGVQDIKLQQDIEEQKLKIQKDSAAKQKDVLKKLSTDMRDTFEAFNTYFEQVIDRNIAAIDHQEQVQKDATDTNKALAKEGLANELAFEQKRTVDLEKARIAEQKKLKKEKEFEVFINAVAKFSETDPKTAVPKALGVLAATKIGEAVFGEKGGIIGENNEKSYVSLFGMSRTHTSKKDVLLHAEKGEGLLTVKEMDNLGGKQGFMALKSMLNTPMLEKPLPSYSAAILALNTKGIESRLDSVERAIKNQPTEPSFRLNELQEWVETEIKNGLKTVTIHKRRI